MKKQKFGWGYLLFALLFTVLGIVFLAIVEALDALAICVGIILCLFGIVYAIITLSRPGRGVKFFFNIVFSILALACGVTTAVFTGNSVSVILTLSGLLLIIDGAFKLQTSIRLRSGRSILFWIMCVLALPTILLGFVLIKFLPEEVAPWCNIVLGIALLLDAFNNFINAFAQHKLNSPALRAIEEENEEHPKAPESERASTQEENADVSVAQEISDTQNAQNNETQSECPPPTEATESTAQSLPQQDTETVADDVQNDTESDTTAEESDGTETHN